MSARTVVAGAICAMLFGILDLVAAGGAPASSIVAVFALFAAAGAAASVVLLAFTAPLRVLSGLSARFWVASYSAALVILAGHYALRTPMTVGESGHWRFYSVVATLAWTTLAGLVLVTHGSIPETGAHVRVEGVDIEVLEATRRRLLALRVHLPRANELAATRRSSVE